LLVHADGAPVAGLAGGQTPATLRVCAALAPTAAPANARAATLPKEALRIMDCSASFGPLRLSRQAPPVTALAKHCRLGHGYGVGRKIQTEAPSLPLARTAR
jgi:hypothetical protein